ncbi:DNA alkylation repair protein [Leucothrix arctica]|uniref:DNA alkylation repair protein n=1 Tax=Leucothrix arctica TaxID=1481894 RepID=A0A317CE44_9GAMM|nr:DNA alkylation repair protein [Leucothrix arctica]PWQ94570.1 DNA alkylation repair protein [Leucothrix arctica]
MEPFKNLFSPSLVKCIAFHLNKHIINFDAEGFENNILETLETLELKGRAQLISDQLHVVLPNDDKARQKVLYTILHPEELDNGDKPSDEDGIRNWGIFPLTLVVGQHGTHDIEESLLLLKAMTKRFTSEFGIRDLLIADQSKALMVLQQWLTDPNKHVRRLISEGTRPRLPWGKQLPELIKDPTPMLPVLEALRDDKEEYVRRSVANHLNDIAKDHPDLVATIANDWMKGADKNREKLIRHACRSLIKQGHPLALKAFGIEPPDITLIDLSLTSSTVAFGSSLEFNVNLKSNSDKAQQLIIDYSIHFLKANGKLAPKVFKGTKVTLEAGASYQFQKRHAIKPITTRRCYAGLHALSLRINGNDFGYIEFDLIMSEH